MFAKLLKQEWLSTRKLIGILCLAIFVSGLLVGGILRYMTWSAVTGNGFMVILYTVVLTVAILVIAGSCFAAMYLLVYRFYKSRFTDEGYLTFTLPVTEHQLLLSSIVNTIVGVVIVGAVTCITVALALGIFLSSFQEPAGTDIMQIFLDAVAAAAADLDIQGNLTLLLASEAICGFFTDLIALMLAVTVGALSSKHGVLKGLGCYFGISAAVSVASTVVTEAPRSIGTASILCSAGINLLIALGGYFLMHYLLRKKLNLT